jgi:NitT/TauT family transport system permease protein
VIGGFVAIVVLASALWELYKLMAAVTGGTIPFTDIPLPVRADDRSMPHVWTVVGALFEAPRRGDEEILLVALVRSALFTLRSALAGLVLGSLVGFGLGVTFVRSSLAERGLMPYVVGSQTVPLIAIAPMVVIWGGKLQFPSWVAVAAISAYLSFFPVTINTIRGLRSPAATATEMMRSYAASPSEVLWKLQVPAALPAIFTALRIAAASSVVGAIVGELPAGMAEGLGRQLLTFAYYFVSGPEKLFASMIVAAGAGVSFVALVALLERWVVPARRRLAQ